MWDIFIVKGVRVRGARLLLQPASGQVGLCKNGVKRQKEKDRASHPGVSTETSPQGEKVPAFLIYPHYDRIYQTNPILLSGDIVSPIV